MTALDFELEIRPGATGSYPVVRWCWRPICPRRRTRRWWRSTCRRSDRVPVHYDRQRGRWRSELDEWQQRQG